MWLHVVIHIRVQVTTSPANWRLLPNARLNWTDVVDGGQALNEHWINIWCLLGMNNFPANTQHLYKICTKLDQRRRRWADVVQMLYSCFVFAGSEINSQGQGQRKRGYFDKHSPTFYLYLNQPLKYSVLGWIFVLGQQHERNEST